jgi:hypothetical protein
VRQLSAPYRGTTRERIAARNSSEAWRFYLDVGIFARSMQFTAGESTIDLGQIARFGWCHPIVRIAQQNRNLPFESAARARQRSTSTQG